MPEAKIVFAGGSALLFDFKMTGGSVVVNKQSGSIGNMFSDPNFGSYGNFSVTGGTIDLEEGTFLWVCSDNEIRRLGTTDDKVDTSMYLGGSAVINMNGAGLRIGDAKDNDSLELAGATLQINQNLSETPLTSYIHTTDIYQTAGDVNVYSGTLKAYRRVTNESDDIADWNITGGALNIKTDATADLYMNLNVSDGGVVRNEGTLNLKDFVYGATSTDNDTVRLDPDAVKDMVGNKSKTTLQVPHGGHVINNGNLNAAHVNIENGGILETTAFLTEEGLNSGENSTGTFTVDSLTLNEGGTLKLTTLNSNVGEGKAETHADNNRWLVQYTVNLNGGAVIDASGNALNHIKVGTASQSGTLNISGNYSFDSIETSRVGSITMEDGTLSIGSLALSGTFTQNGGIVTVGTLTQNPNTNGSYTLAGGTLKTDVSNIFSKTEEGNWNWETASDVLTASGGVLELTGIGSYTLDQYETAFKAINGS